MSDVPTWYEPLQLLRSFAEQPETKKAASAIAKSYLESIATGEPSESTPPAPAKPKGSFQHTIADDVFAKASALVAGGLSMRRAAEQTGISYGSLQKRMGKVNRPPLKRGGKRKAASAKVKRGLPRPMGRPRSEDGKSAAKSK